MDSSMIYFNVKELADKRGITIRMLEQRTGLANGTIGKWRNKTPRISSLEAVARALKVTVNQLLKERSDTDAESSD